MPFPEGAEVFAQMLMSSKKQYISIRTNDSTAHGMGTWNQASENVAVECPGPRLTTSDM